MTFLAIVAVEKKKCQLIYRNFELYRKKLNASRLINFIPSR